MQEARPIGSPALAIYLVPICSLRNTTSLLCASNTNIKEAGIGLVVPSLNARKDVLVTLKTECNIVF